MNNKPKNSLEFIELIDDLFYQAKLDNKIKHGGGITREKENSKLEIYIDGKIFTIDTKDIKIKDF